MSAISKSRMVSIAIIIFAAVDPSAQFRLASLSSTLPSLLNSTDVDQVMLGIELQKVDQRVKEYLDGNKEIDESDEHEMQSIQEKLAVGIKNAEQGEMGCPFAQTKINDIKKSLIALRDNAIEETDSGLKVWHDIQNQDQKALQKNDIKLNVFDTVYPKINKELTVFAQVMKLDKMVEQIKNDGPDQELLELQSSFKEQLKKIDEAQGRHIQKPKTLDQQITHEQNQEDKMDTQDIIMEEDDKLYSNPNKGLKMSEINEKINGNEQEESNKEQNDDEQQKDHDQDPKPDNNVNLQTDEMSTEKNKATQWSSDGDFLAYQSYQMSSNQSQFGQKQKETPQDITQVEIDQEPKVIQVE